MSGVAALRWGVEHSRYRLMLTGRRRRRARSITKMCDSNFDKQAQTMLMPIVGRGQLNELPDELWTRLISEYYKDAAHAVFKPVAE